MDRLGGRFRYICFAPLSSNVSARSPRMLCPIAQRLLPCTAFASVAEGLSAIWAMSSEDFGKVSHAFPRVTRLLLTTAPHSSKSLPSDKKIQLSFSIPFLYMDNIILFNDLILDSLFDVPPTSRFQYFMSKALVLSLCKSSQLLNLCPLSFW